MKYFFKFWFPYFLKFGHPIRRFFEILLYTFVYTIKCFWHGDVLPYNTSIFGKETHSYDNYMEFEDFMAGLCFLAFSALGFSFYQGVYEGKIFSFFFIVFMLSLILFWFGLLGEYSNLEERFPPKE